DENDRGGRELRTELRERRQPEGVVDEAGDEEDGAAAEDAGKLLARRDDTGRDGDAGRGQQADEDAAAPEERRRALVPAISPWCGDDVLRRRGAPERPDREQAHGKSGERGRDDRHRA